MAFDVLFALIFNLKTQKLQHKLKLRQKEGQVPTKQNKTNNTKNTQKQQHRNNRNVIKTNNTTQNKIKNTSQQNTTKA